MQDSLTIPGQQLLYITNALAVHAESSVSFSSARPSQNSTSKITHAFFTNTTT